MEKRRADNLPLLNGSHPPLGSGILDVEVLLNELSLQVLDMSLLVEAVLAVVGSSHEELEGDAVVLRVQVALALEQIDPVESIIAPALAHFEL